MYDRRLSSESMQQPYLPPRNYNTTMEIGLWVAPH
jgi:hypothetical protein